MYKHSVYTSADKMSELICDNYPMLLVMSRFGIPLGFGDQTIAEVCADHGVDTGTFLAVVNTLASGRVAATSGGSNVSAESLLSYLKNSHDYYLDFRLPRLRSKLAETIGQDDISQAIIRFFDNYVAEVRKHMHYEERSVFPYVRALLAGNPDPHYRIDIFRRRHDPIEASLTELKNIIIKYYPSTEANANEINSILFDIFVCEQDLASHNKVEDLLLVPLIAELETQTAR